MNVVDTNHAAASGGPYVGLRPYTKEKAAFFFGRDNEQTVLISNLRASRLTLLYAQSGVGKSSLLRAGVAVTLEGLAQRGLDQRGTARYIPVVFSSWQDDPVTGLIGKIREAIIPFLRDAAPPTSAPGQLDQAIEAASTATGATLLVILDQFEDYLLYHPRAAGDESFADQLAACVNRAALRAKFLISIREDAYFSLGDLFKGRISNVYGNYYHLDPLTRAAARQAIVEPVASYNRLHPGQVPVRIDPRLVDIVLDGLRAGRSGPDQGDTGRLGEGNRADPHRDEVTAPYLQLIMKRLWGTELASGSRKLRARTLVKKLGGTREIIRTHVDQVLGDLSEEERDVALDIFRYLVTPSGTKNALTASELAGYSSHSIDKINVLLRQLVGSDDRILTTIPPPSGQTDGMRYVISHDLLVPIIQDWAEPLMEARLEHQKKEAERQAQREKRRAHMFGLLAIAAGILVVVVVVLAVLTKNAGDAAVTQSNAAQSEEMAAEAMNLLPADGPLAMLLGLQAYERAPTLQAESALIQATQQPLDELLVPGSPVRSIAFSPRRRVLAAGESGGHVSLWDMATGHKTATLAAGSAVYGVAFSPDGQILAAGDVSGHVSLWDVATRRRIATLPEGGAVFSVAFSPDRRTLAVSESGGRIGLWDVTTRHRIATLAEGSPAASVAFSPDGQILAAGDVDGQVSLRDVATRRRIATLPEGGAVYGVAFSPDGRTLAAGVGSGHVGLWEVATRHRIATLAEGSPAASVAFSRDGQILAAGDYGGHVGLWDVTTRHRIATLAEGSVVYGVAFSPDGQTLAAGDVGGEIGLWDMADAQRPAKIAEGSPVESVAFSPDGQILAAGDVNGGIGLWDVATGHKTAALAEGSTAQSVAFSPDGQTLAVGDYSGRVGVWNARTRRKTITLAEGSLVESVAFSPDGQTLAAGDVGGDVGLWNVTTGRKMFTLDEGTRVASVAFSPDGRTLVVGDRGGHVGLWDVATGRETATLAEGSAVYALAFSPDGHTLAVGGLGGHVGLWDVAVRQETANLAEANTVQSVAFSPDGMLVTGDPLGNVGIWNPGDRQRVAILTEGGPVTSLAFSSHYPVLAIGGLDGSIVILRQNLADLTQRQFVQLVCGKVQESMTQAQWADYAPGQEYQRTCP